MDEYRIGRAPRICKPSECIYQNLQGVTSWSPVAVPTLSSLVSPCHISLIAKLATTVTCTNISRLKGKSVIWSETLAGQSCAIYFQAKNVQRAAHHEWESSFRTSPRPQKDVCKFANYSPRSSLSAEPVAKLILGLKLKRPPPHHQSISYVSSISVRFYINIYTEASLRSHSQRWFATSHCNKSYCARDVAKARVFFH